MNKMHPLKDILDILCKLQTNHMCYADCYILRYGILDFNKKSILLEQKGSTADIIQIRNQEYV